MSNDQAPKPVMVVMTEELARRSLEAANVVGLSRSELVRQLLAGYLEQSGETSE